MDRRGRDAGPSAGPDHALSRRFIDVERAARPREPMRGRQLWLVVHRLEQKPKPSLVRYARLRQPREGPPSPAQAMAQEACPLIPRSALNLADIVCRPHQLATG